MLNIIAAVHSGNGMFHVQHLHYFAENKKMSSEPSTTRRSRDEGRSHRKSCQARDLENVRRW